MKTKITVLLTMLLAMLTSTAVLGATNYNITPILDFGIIFKAPEATDKQYHVLFEKMPEVKGTEIYLNWSDIEKTEGKYDWSVFDKYAAKYKTLGKKISVSVSAASFAINDSPAWLFNNYNVRRIAKGYWLNFENGDRRYIIKDPVIQGYAVTNTGSKAVRATRPDSIETNPEAHPLTSTNGYSIQFDYKLEAASTLVVKIFSKSFPQDTKTFEWKGQAGEKGSKTAEFIPEAMTDDYTVQFGVKSGSAIIDNVNIVEMKTGFFVGNLTFPNYFDPMFMEKYSNFVKAFADKYRDDPQVGIVYVGGFGRWEELTLCNDIASELNALEDQWTTFGYTDESYINHVKECADLYKNTFKDKPLMMTIAGYKGTDNFKNQPLLDWTISQYVAKKGIILKYNGWQEKNTEWNNESNPIYYTVYRHKNNPDTKLIFEQGAQVNNMSSNIIGYPISLMNKAIGYGADYYWIYNNDIQDPYLSRYNHYLNESAGGVLNTKIFAQMMKFDYYSTNAKKSFNHYNITYQVYQNQGDNRSKSDFVTIDGVQAAKTNGVNSLIKMSIDDRIKVAGSYSARLNLEYYDEGTDSFIVRIKNDKGEEDLATIKKTGTKQWTTVALDASSVMNTWRGGSQDSFAEIIVDDAGDGFDTIKSFEIDYIPADDFKQDTVMSVEPKGTEKLDLENSVVFEISLPKDKRVDTLSIPFMKSGKVEISGAMATVEAFIDGKYQQITKKECHMPEDLLWTDITIGNFAQYDKLRITLRAIKGTVFVAANDSKPAYRLKNYTVDTSDTIKIDTLGNFRADMPFKSIIIDKGVDVSKAALATILMDGKESKSFPALTGKDAKGNHILYFEPKTAGKYKIEGITAKNIMLGSLIRINNSKAAVRDLAGDIETGFKNLKWSQPSGFSDLKAIKGGFTGSLSSKNASLETKTPFTIEANRSHQFHFIIKNETSSSLAKLYWKTATKGYSEDNSVWIPVIANDTQYREYSYLLGYDKIYLNSKEITGLKLVPAYGNLQAGKISLMALELRNGRKAINAYNELLDVTKIVSETSVDVPKSSITGALSQNTIIIITIAAALAMLLIIALLTMRSIKKPKD